MQSYVGLHYLNEMYSICGKKWDQRDEQKKSWEFTSYSIPWFRHNEKITFPLAELIAIL